jgi:hypothetical protein
MENNTKPTCGNDSAYNPVQPKDKTCVFYPPQPTVDTIYTQNAPANLPAVIDVLREKTNS